MDTLQIATLSEAILEREAQRSESEARDIIHELDKLNYSLIIPEHLHPRILSDFLFQQPGNL